MEFWEEQDSSDDLLLSRWVFEVRYDDDGVTTYSHVVTRDKEEQHATIGPLHEAIIEAYEAVGLVCPLVVEKDLLKLNESQDGVEP